MASKNPRLAALGNAVRRIRAELGLTQEALAFRAGLHFTYISGIERGERNIGYLAIVKIAQALGIRASELVRRAEALGNKRGRVAARP